MENLTITHHKELGKALAKVVSILTGIEANKIEILQGVEIKNLYENFEVDMCIDLKYIVMDRDKNEEI